MNRVHLRSIIVLALLVLTGCSTSDELDQADMPPLVSVETGVLEVTTLHRHVQGYGTVEPAPADADAPPAAAGLAAPVAGVVNRVAVVEGQQVGKGDLLVEMNSSSTTAENAERELARQRRLYAQENTSLKDLQAAEAQLTLLRVTAPLSGTVVHVNVSPGQAVDLNTVVAEVMDLERLVVRVEIPVAEAGDLHVGSPVDVMTDPPVRTEISFVSPDVDRRTDAVLVRAPLPARVGLRPGRFVSIRVATATHADCLVAPRESVVADERGRPAVALVKGDEAILTPVQTGLQEDGWIEIASPELAAGDTVVTIGAYGLPERTRITIRNSSTVGMSAPAVNTQ